MYYRFIERNITSEGEIWNAFIKIPENQKETEALEAFNRLVKLSDNSDEEDSYYFYGLQEGVKVEYTEEQVDLLLIENNFSMSGYMNSYMIGEVSELVFEASERVKDDTPWYDVQDELYKMKLIKKIRIE